MFYQTWNPVRPRCTSSVGRRTYSGFPREIQRNKGTAPSPHNYKHRSRGTSAGSHNYVSLLKACAASKDLHHAMQIQAHLAQHKVPLTGLLGDYLIVTLAKCGAFEEAFHISQTLSCRTVYSWTAILGAYADHGFGEEALAMFQSMLEDGVLPDPHTFVSLFKACGVVSDLDQGKRFHSQAIKRGFTSDVFVLSTLVSMYGKCDALAEAEYIFWRLSYRTVVSWNAMLSAYVDQGYGDKALQLYALMQVENVEPYFLTSVIVLQACAMVIEKQNKYFGNEWKSKAVVMEIGQALHADSDRKGFAGNLYVGSALVTMYGKCGNVENAEHVFSRLLDHGFVSWFAMISTYVEQGHPDRALVLYDQLEQLNVTWDPATLTCILQACGATGSLETLHRFYSGIISAGFDNIYHVAATLIHAYGSCASMIGAQAIFDSIPEPTVVLWNACIAGHAGEGDFLACLECFEELVLVGLSPDSVSFNSALSVCSHSGQSEKGFQYLECMKKCFGLHPDLKHYGSLLDLLGRAGNFKMLEIMLHKLQMPADLSVWLCLLGACRVHGNVELAKHAFDQAVQLQPKQDTAYVVMSNIYGEAGLLEYTEMIDSYRDNKCGI